jgi:uncharacterized membrane protein
VNSQSQRRPFWEKRWFAVARIAVVLLSLYPISLSVRSGNWFSVVLLLVLDVAVVVVWIYGARNAERLRGEPRPSTDEGR